MFQLDESMLSSDRTLITINGQKETISRISKNGTLNYVADKDNNLYLTIPTTLNGGEYNRIIQEMPDGTIPGNLTFSGSITINEDLVVLGNKTKLDVLDLSIEDNIIELNKNETGPGITLGSSGLQVNRGTKASANWLYDEATDRDGHGAFVNDLGGDIKFWIYDDGNVKISGELDVNKIKTNDLLMFNSSVSSTSLKDAKIEVARGVLNNASLLWDETEDIWKAGLKDLEQAIVLNNDPRISNLSSSGTIGWSSISEKPTSLVLDIDDAVLKRHKQNTDNVLTGALANTINTTGIGNIVDFKVNGDTKSSIDKDGNFSGYAYATQLVFTQNTPSLSWTIDHNLNKIPTVIVIDNDRYFMQADIKYVDNNTITLEFSEPFSGEAYIS